MTATGQPSNLASPVIDARPQCRPISKKLPASSAKLHRVLVEAWPRLTRRVAFIEGALETVEILDTDVVVSSHACGALTDVVLARAAAAHARVAVLPCCHDLALGEDGGVSGWIDGPLAIDIRRAYQLSERGYRIWTQTISGDITPKNRLLLGAPRLS